MVVSSGKLGKTKGGADNGSYNQEFEIEHAKMSNWPLLSHAFL